MTTMKTVTNSTKKRSMLWRKKVHFCLVEEDEGDVRQLLADVSKQKNQPELFFVNFNKTINFLEIFLSMINKEMGFFIR